MPLLSRYTGTNADALQILQVDLLPFWVRHLQVVPVRGYFSAEYELLAGTYSPREIMLAEEAY